MTLIYITLISASEFADMLNRMRMGDTTAKDSVKLKRLSRQLVGEDGVDLEPTEL